jgi:hypothetical protein
MSVSLKIGKGSLTIRLKTKKASARKNETAHKNKNRLP